MKKVKLFKLHCLRCGKEWTPRTEEVRICPECKSAYFDKPKRESKESEVRE